jgi:hypothetical protein
VSSSTAEASPFFGTPTGTGRNRPAGLSEDYGESRAFTCVSIYSSFTCVSIYSCLSGHARMTVHIAARYQASLELMWLLILHAGDTVLVDSDGAVRPFPNSHLGGSAQRARRASSGSWHESQPILPSPSAAHASTNTGYVGT